MRLDKFLKVSRIIKRRTVANEAAGAGRIAVNGKIVKPGDVLDILLGGKHVLVKINATPEVVRKEEADSLYTLLEN